MYETTSGFPLTKVLASTAAGAITTIIVWLLNTYAHAAVPDYVAGSLVTVISAVIGYITPLLPGEVQPIKSNPVVTMPPDAGEK